MTPSRALVFDTNNIWSAPLDLSSGDIAPSEVYQPTSTTQLLALTYLFLRGEDCRVSEWQATTQCSVQCGGGVMQEARSIKAEARRGGIACPAPGGLVRETQCNKAPCPVDCKVTDWARDGECSSHAKVVRYDRRGKYYTQQVTEAW